MNKVRIKELDSLFVLRHAQRCDKVASTISSIDFVHSNNHHSLNGNNDYIVGDTYNPGLATFESTANKSNNGYIQSMEMGRKILSYIQDHVKETIVVLKVHTSPYLRCLETLKFMIDFIIKKHRDDKLIKIELSIDQVLSEWLNTELDINYFPPNDDGASLLNTAIQYLNSNLSFNKNENVKIFMNLNDSYKHGHPGPYSETFLQQFTRLNKGLISIIREDSHNLSKEPDSTDIVLLMTHGACVRSLVSKLLGKSLFVEIPLASMTLAKPSFQDAKHYYWRLIETDIELRAMINFEQVDIYSSRDPFRDIQTTFSRNKAPTQLNFKNGVIASKTENFNRIRSQSLLNPSASRSHDSDSDSDSDNEGISFQARSRRQSTTHGDSQRRFRSSSLFGPKVPFFNDPSNPNSRKSSREDFNLLNSEKFSGSGLKRNTSFLSPKFNSNSTNLSRFNSNDYTFKSSDSLNLISSSKYRNIDEDDGTHGFSHGEVVPDLEELSSNNSSTNSIHEDLTKKLLDAKLSSEDSSKSTSSIITMTPPHSKIYGDHVQNFPMALDSRTTLNEGSSSLDTEKSSNSSRIFDKSLIEKTLKEINKVDTSEDDTKPTYNWMNFNNSPTSPVVPNGNKFKIDLYGNKNKYNLSLYGDDNDSESSGSWFLGSNKY